MDDVIHELELEHTETVASNGAAMDGGYGWDWEVRGRERTSGSNGVKPNCDGRDRGGGGGDVKADSFGIPLIYPNTNRISN